jgi:hypothetical protein
MRMILCFGCMHHDVAIAVDVGRSKVVMFYIANNHESV